MIVKNNVLLNKTLIRENSFHCITFCHSTTYKLFTFMFQAGKKSRLANPEFEEARLREINAKIDEKKQQLQQPDTFTNTKHISR